MVQISLTVAVAVLFVAAPYLDYDPRKISFLYTAVVLIGLACLLGNIITLLIVLIRQKSERRKLLIPGIRNILLIPSALIVSQMHGVGWWYDPGAIEGQRYDFWYTEYLWYALALAVMLFLISFLIETAVQKMRKAE